MEITLIQAISNRIAAIENCKRTGNAEWEEKHRDTLAQLEKMLPSGSGVDSGTTIDPKSTSSKVILKFSYHHMDEHGGYDGWTDHTAVITPAFFSVNVLITGKDRNGIKEYLSSLFEDNLVTTEI